MTSIPRAPSTRTRWNHSASRSSWRSRGGRLREKGFPYLWIAERDEPSAPVHVALRADDHAAVDAFFDAAMEVGGTDNGGPGMRPQYHEHYYGAFVLDPDGNNIEAVCHRSAD